MVVSHSKEKTEHVEEKTIKQRGKKQKEQTKKSNFKISKTIQGKQNSKNQRNSKR